MKSIKNITKRSLALLLALVMCFSVMSVCAFATEGDPEPLPPSAANNNITDLPIYFVELMCKTHSAQEKRWHDEVNPINVSWSDFEPGQIVPDTSISGYTHSCVMKPVMTENLSAQIQSKGCFTTVMKCSKFGYDVSDVIAGLEKELTVYYNPNDHMWTSFTPYGREWPSSGQYVGAYVTLRLDHAKSPEKPVASDFGNFMIQVNGDSGKQTEEKLADKLAFTSYATAEVIPNDNPNNKGSYPYAFDIQLDA